MRPFLGLDVLKKLYVVLNLALELQLLLFVEAVLLTELASRLADVFPRVNRQTVLLLITRVNIEMHDGFSLEQVLLRGTVIQNSLQTLSLFRSVMLKDVHLLELDGPEGVLEPLLGECLLLLLLLEFLQRGRPLVDVV
uniref:Uncharacterized protein n=1 Tax=Strombidium inclinatum TaxID=197538 RepID=A0A7S3IPA6_9SPIT